MGEFRMPSLGADMDVGTIVEWLVKPGDAVRRGQIVAVVDTAKAAIEIEAFEEGVVTEILVGTGVQVPVGTPLAMIGTPTAAASSIRSPGPRATPPVRHLAHQLGVDLKAVHGTGPDGHITHDDVVRAAPAPTPAAAPTPAHLVRIPERSDSSNPDGTGGPRDGGQRGGRGGAAGRCGRAMADGRCGTGRCGRGRRGAGRCWCGGTASGDSAGPADRRRAWRRPGACCRNRCSRGSARR